VRRSRGTCDAKHLLRHGARGGRRHEHGFDGAIEIEIERDVAHLAVTFEPDVFERGNGLRLRAAARAHDRPAQFDETCGDRVQKYSEDFSPIDFPLVGEVVRTHAHAVGVGCGAHVIAQFLSQIRIDAVIGREQTHGARDRVGIAR